MFLHSSHDAGAEGPEKKDGAPLWTDTDSGAAPGPQAGQAGGGPAPVAQADNGAQLELQVRDTVLKENLQADLEARLRIRKLGVMIEELGLNRTRETELNLSDDEEKRLGLLQVKFHGKSTEDVKEAMDALRDLPKERALFLEESAKYHRKKAGSVVGRAGLFDSGLAFTGLMMAFCGIFLFVAFRLTGIVMIVAGLCICFASFSNAMKAARKERAKQAELRRMARNLDEISERIGDMEDCVKDICLSLHIQDRQRTEGIQEAYQEALEMETLTDRFVEYSRMMRENRSVDLHRDISKELRDMFGCQPMDESDYRKILGILDQVIAGNLPKKKDAAGNALEGEPEEALEEVPEETLECQEGRAESSTDPEGQESQESQESQAGMECQAGGANPERAGSQESQEGGHKDDGAANVANAAAMNEADGKENVMREDETDEFTGNVGEKELAEDMDMDTDMDDFLEEDEFRKILDNISQNLPKTFLDEHVPGDGHDA